MASYSYTAKLQLLPCPFCGSEAETDEGHNEPHTQFVECSNENCLTILHGKDAYERWNKRCYGPKTPQWIPVSERVPEHERSVLIAMADGRVTKTAYYRREFIMPSKEQPTHWMPLPSSPYATGMPSSKE